MDVNTYIPARDAWQGRLQGCMQITSTITSESFAESSAVDSTSGTISVICGCSNAFADVHLPATGSNFELRPEIRT